MTENHINHVKATIYFAIIVIDLTRLIFLITKINYVVT